MSGFLRKANYWVRRKTRLPLVLFCSFIVLILFFNEETSLSRNAEYERQIMVLNNKIDECKDSADYYRQQREAILHHGADIERIAREKFHMQRPTEDVFIIK